MPRLSAAMLGTARAGVAWPAYVPAAHGEGIVHLGIGAFHRAHQAVYTDDVLAMSGGDWRIIGISLRSPDVRDQLAPQDGLYSVQELADAPGRLRVIGAVARIIVAPEESTAVTAVISNPAIHVVTLTITEKGYCHDPATGRLDAGHPAIVREMSGGVPETAIGHLAAGLRARADAGGPPLTLLSCDNLPANGAILRSVLRDYLQHIDPALLDWMDAHVRTPSTMVDRIVPATTEQDRAQAAELLGATDAGAVKAERFSEWIIEDDFAGPRPPWELAGARFVRDVRPFERIKLRMLNGAHSALAYLGLLRGHETIHQAVADPIVRGVVDCLMRIEVAATLLDIKDFDADAWADALIARFTNPALDHRLRQIAMDGSRKLPQRLIDTILDCRSCGIVPEAAITAVAGWMLHVDRERGRIDDPMAGTLGDIAAAAPDDSSLVAALLRLPSIFGDADRLVWLHGPLVAAMERLRSGIGLLPKNEMRKGEDACQSTPGGGKVSVSGRRS